MGLFDGTKLERPVTCERCGKAMKECRCPRDASGQVKLPGDQVARVRVEKRTKGKMVTVVEGLDAVASDLEGLVKVLRGKCAAGGTVDEGVIEIQGEHVVVVAGVLREMGYRVK